MSYQTPCLAAFLLCVCIWIPNLMAKPATPNEETKTMGYLMKYGYMPMSDARAGVLRTEKQVVQAIKTFQLYAGIPMTGKVDKKTMEMVVMPRCGMQDFSRSDSTRRRKRYAVQGSSWKKRELTYMYQGAPRSSISMSEVEEHMTKAFKEWERVSNLKFTKVTDPQADILVRFKSGSHGDGYPFDGIGGTLAHGFYPLNNEGTSSNPEHSVSRSFPQFSPHSGGVKEGNTLGSPTNRSSVNVTPGMISCNQTWFDVNGGLSGDVHFDDDEEWVLSDKEYGTDFYWTALHEIGHTLGLGHSNYKDAVMFPFYTGFKKNLKLNDDDIQGIRYLYDAPEITLQTAKPPTMTSSPTTYPPGMPNPCNISFDAVFLDTDKVMYFISGLYYWTVHETGERKGPFNVIDKWTRLPADGIDAAYQSNGNITFFSGTNCWVYSGTKYILGPIAITKRFPMLQPSNSTIDAAFVWGANSKTYLFSGDKYWRYNEASSRIDMGYPVPIKGSWIGVPNGIDSAMTWLDRKTYFFKGRNFWIFDNVNIRTTDIESMKISAYWMKCLTLTLTVENTPSSSANILRMSTAFVVIVLGMLLSVITNT